MTRPYADVWLSDSAEERIVLGCLLNFAKTGATGFGGKRIRGFAKTGRPQSYVEALKNMGVLDLLDGRDDAYVFHPNEAVKYFSEKRKNPEEILKEFYPNIDLKKSVRNYNRARKGNP